MTADNVEFELATCSELFPTKPIESTLPPAGNIGGIQTPLEAQNSES